MPIVTLNTIAIDPRNPNFFAIAGSDEHAWLYDIRKYKWDGSTDFGQPTDSFCPPHLIGNENVGITGLAFSDQSELLVSYREEYIYLFTRDKGLGPDPVLVSSSSVEGSAAITGSDPVSAAYPSCKGANEKVRLQVYNGHINCKTVKGVNFFGPNCDYVVSGSDCGRIFIWRKTTGGQLLNAMKADKCVVNCTEPHPHATILASSGIENDVKIWSPKAMERASLC